VEKQEEGRAVTPAGRSFLDNASFKLKKDIPELANY
jgi:small subunit ribosomal protein S19e